MLGLGNRLASRITVAPHEAIEKKRQHGSVFLEGTTSFWDLSVLFHGEHSSRVTFSVLGCNRRSFSGFTESCRRSRLGIDIWWLMVFVQENMVGVPSAISPLCEVE